MCLIDLDKGFGHDRVSCCVYLDHVVRVFGMYTQKWGALVSINQPLSTVGFPLLMSLVSSCVTESMGAPTLVLIVSGFTYDPMKSVSVT